MSKAFTEFLPDETIISKIHFVRGQKVMLDRDLALMFGTTPTRLRQALKRNLSRFPAHFTFQLNEDETDTMVSQNVIPSRRSLGGGLPYVFTKHGVLMLANFLKSKPAINASIKIIKVFVKLREMLLTHKDILLKLEQLECHVLQNSEEIAVIFEALKGLLNPPQEPRPAIGFKRSTDTAA